MEKDITTKPIRFKIERHKIEGSDKTYSYFLPSFFGSPLKYDDGKMGARAIKALSRYAEKIVSALIEEKELNRKRRIFGTRDGEVLLFEYRHYGGWGYEIVGPDRECPSGTAFAEGTTREEAEEKLRNHAEQSYGGIIWEFSV